ncbi:hypothetical protein KP509_33G024500 [Ceratopteris richardii]|nr:hypothetical protein KP509_33G024500 [Ceratopteris richardii]
MWIDQLFSEYIPPGPVHLHLLNERDRILGENNSEPPGLWDPPKSYGWKPCLDGNGNIPVKHRVQNRYLQVFCTGGLFQLHICVCNAVTVAWLLNASLVVPYFEESAVWKDPSAFGDIYDVEHFQSSLKNEVHIVHQLPPEFEWSTPQYYESKCLERPNCFLYIPKHSKKEWYFENVLPALESYGIVVLDRYHHRLSFEGLPYEATQLRCKTNFHSLKFVKPILDLARKLVKRLKIKAKVLQKRAQTKLILTSMNDTETRIKNANGHFLGLHLRFEKDMIAHSACYYGGGLAEKNALASYRRKTFKTFVPKTQFSAEYLRRNGSCPLTPEEVGLLLAGLGFQSITPIYVAGKKSYGGEARVKPLRDMFPHLETKLTLASETELEWFLPFSHKLAALDFMVLLESDTFLSNSAGNFPNVLTGQRTFLGPRKSIHPDKAALFALFSNTSQSWIEFSEAVNAIHKDRQGSPYPRPERYSIYRYPAPDCMCREPMGHL